jgi:hypothetical protein
LDVCSLLLLHFRFATVQFDGRKGLHRSSLFDPRPLLSPTGVAFQRDVENSRLVTLPIHRALLDRVRKLLQQKKTCEIKGMTRLQYTCPVAEVRVKGGLSLQCAYDCYENLQKP